MLKVASSGNENRCGEAVDSCSAVCSRCQRADSACMLGHELLIDLCRKCIPVGGGCATAYRELDGSISTVFVPGVGPSPHRDREGGDF